MDTHQLFLLFVLYQIKHFVCDYLLQAPFFRYMSGKFNFVGWVKPLLVHSGIHAMATLVLSFVFTQDLVFSLTMAFVDLSIHFTMDRIKASPMIWGRFTIEQPQFWISLGADQMVHHFTHYLIIFLTWYKMSL